MFDLHTMVSVRDLRIFSGTARDQSTLLRGFLIPVLSALRRIYIGPRFCRELVCEKIKMIHSKVLLTKHHNSKGHIEHLD